MILPAAVRHLAELKAARRRRRWSRRPSALVERARTSAILALEKANATTPARRTASSMAKYMRDTVIPAMDGDARRRPTSSSSIVADDLWPLPKYSEMLFIK